METTEKIEEKGCEAGSADASAVSPNILGTESIPKLLLKFAVPGVISMVVNSLYNIVDQIFIGRGVGYLGNGATTVIFPMTALAMAFVFMVGDGTASYMSLKLGEKKDEDAAKGAAAGMIGTLMVGVILFVVYNIFLEQLCRIFGASDAILPYAVDYGRIISIGMIFFAVCGGMSSFIRADGSPKFTMAGLLTGCIINVILDPIMIFVCGYGVKGAAFATIVGQFVNCCMNIWYCFHMKSVKIDKKILKDSVAYIPKVMRLGVSSCLNELAIVVAMAARNNILVHYGALSKYGEDIPITTLGITMKVFSIIISVIIGTSVGAQPIMGYNYGSRQFGRVKKTFKFVVIVTTFIMIVAFLCAQLFPRQIIGIFGNDESDVYYEFAIRTMRIYLMLIPIGGLQVVSGIFFQALGYPAQASVLSLSKQIIFQLPATLVLPIFMGVEGALWAGPFSDITAFILTVIMLRYYWKKIFSDENTRLNAL